MDEARLARQIEREGAEALLDAGVSVPLLEFHVPFRDKPVPLRVTMRRPCLGGMVAIAREWLRTDTTAEQMWNFSKEDEMRFVATHSMELSRIVAWTLCRGWVARKLLVGPVAWAVRQWMQPRHMASVMKRYVALMGTDPFLSIIASAEAVNPMKLRASQGGKGS